MKVSKLIELLQKENQDAVVVVSSHGVDYEVAEEVSEDDGDVLIIGKINRSF